MAKKVYLIRPFPHDEYRLEEFLSGGFIAVGWTLTGDLAGSREADIRKALKGVNHERYKSISAISTLKTLVIDMNIGDYVIVPDDNNIYIGRIKDDYRYSQKQHEENYAHQRPIEWLVTDLERETLPEELKKSLRVPRTSANISKHLEIVERIVNQDDLSTMSDDSESDDLVQHAKDVLSSHLQSDDPMVQLEAAKIILSTMQKK